MCHRDGCEICHKRNPLKDGEFKTIEDKTGRGEDKHYALCIKAVKKSRTICTSAEETWSYYSKYAHTGQTQAKCPGCLEVQMEKAKDARRATKMAYYYANKERKQQSGSTSHAGHSKPAQSSSSNLPPQDPSFGAPTQGHLESDVRHSGFRERMADDQASRPQSAAPPLGYETSQGFHQSEGTDIRTQIQTQGSLRDPGATYRPGQPSNLLEQPLQDQSYAPIPNAYISAETSSTPSMRPVNRQPSLTDPDYDYQDIAHGNTQQLQAMLAAYHGKTTGLNDVSQALQDTNLNDATANDPGMIQPQGYTTGTYQPQGYYPPTIQPQGYTTGGFQQQGHRPGGISGEVGDPDDVRHSASTRNIRIQRPSQSQQQGSNRSTRQPQNPERGKIAKPKPKPRRP